MKGIWMLAAGFAAGYALGARAGRARYGQIAAQAERLWRSARPSGAVAEDAVPEERDPASAAADRVAAASLLARQNDSPEEATRP